MTDREAFEAWVKSTLPPGAQANVFDAKDRDESITWKAWQAAIKQEREAIAAIVEQMTQRERQARSWGDAKPVAPCEIAAAIRARSEDREG